MGLFDSIKKAVAGSSGSGNSIGKAVSGAASAINSVKKNKTVEVSFPKLPETLEEFKAMPQASLTDPFNVAALVVVALTFYPKNKELSISMLNFLKGPQPLNQREIQFLNDRFMDKDYVPRSFFGGAVPSNDYTPSVPYTVKVSDNPYSYESQGYAKLFLFSGGADSERPVQLRSAKDGKWYLWEQFLLSDIRPPESSNPWA